MLQKSPAFPSTDPFNENPHSMTCSRLIASRDARTTPKPRQSDRSRLAINRLYLYKEAQNSGYARGRSERRGAPQFANWIDHDC